MTLMSSSHRSFGDLHETQRRVGTDDRERQHQNEPVFPTKAWWPVRAESAASLCALDLSRFGYEFGGCVDWWTRRLKWACFEIVIVKSAVKPDRKLSRYL